MARRTKEEALATRNSLLEAAESLFQQRGVSRTTLNDIAVAAGVTRGAVYWHFKDKADLFSQLMESVELPLEEHLRALDAADVPDQLVHIRNTIVNALVTLESDPKMCRLVEIANHKIELVDEMLVVRDRHLETRAGWIACMKRGFERSARRGELRASVRPATIALTLWSLIDGLVHNWLLSPDQFKLSTSGAQALDLLLAGVRSPQEQTASERTTTRRKSTSSA